MNCTARPLIAALTMALICGCASVAPPVTPDDHLTVPDTFSLYPADAPRDTHWWQAFDTDELNRLVSEALSNDLSIASARARLDQAELRIRQANAALVPSISLDSSVGTSRSRQDTGFFPGQTVERESYTLGLAAAYEIDLWGRIRAERRAILHQADAQREDLAAAEISVAAAVCQTWTDWVATRMMRTRLAEQLETNRQMLELMEMRFRRAMVTAVDLSRQRQSVAAIEAAIPTVAATEQTLAHALAILLGRMPTDLPALNATRLPSLPPAPTTGLPAEVLARRPDIRRAGARLRASAAKVASARANRLPSLRLTGSAAYSASTPGALFDNWITALAAGLTGPIFDAGIRKTEVKRQDALRQETLIAYKQTVLNAIREVEDALVRETRQQEHLAARQRQLTAARTALTEQQARYARGQGNYLHVLEQQVTVWTLEREQIQAQATLLKYRIALHRAIAGRINEDMSL